MTANNRFSCWRVGLFSITFVLLVAAGIAWADTPTRPAESGEGDRVLGRWFPGKKDAVIEITRDGNNYVGHIVWLEEPYDEDGNPRRDVNNPNRRLRDRQNLGLKILRGFTFDGNRWVDGRIYDPDNGKDYRCRMSLDDPNTLRVRGFVGLAAFGRTEIWTRQKKQD